jgi:hypothetical protein
MQDYGQFEMGVRPMTLLEGPNHEITFVRQGDLSDLEVVLAAGLATLSTKNVNSQQEPGLLPQHQTPD